MRVFNTDDEGEDHRTREGARQMITRRTLLPILAAAPFSRLVGDAPVTAQAPAETRILFGGDVMLSRYVGRVAREHNDPALPLRELAPLLSAADIAFVNLEAPFSDKGRVVDAGMVFKAEPEMISALELAGIDVVSTANNHARDCNGYGVEFTLKWLAQHHIAVAGTGKTAEAAHEGTVLIRNGLRFGFLAYTYDQANGNHTDVDDRIAMMDVAALRDDIAQMLGRADVVVVSMHAGLEYSLRPNKQQMDFARAAIDSGAAVVVGHHPHVVQPWQRYRDGVIFYSLGNLVFDQFQRQETQHGLLAQVTFSGKTLSRAEVVPVDIVKTGPKTAPAVPASLAAPSSLGGD